MSALVLALLVPTAAHAAVVISEIAWMGTALNANAEWIELQNTGAESVDLAGWTLTSSTGAPSIILKGSVAGNGFFLLERTSDASVPEVVADQIYSGALPNTGATLYLKNAAGESIDVVDGGTDWEKIRGNNTSKQTPQRTGNSWTEGVPTPHAATGTAGSSDGTASSTDPLTPQDSVQGSPVVVKGSNPVAALSIDAGPGRVVAVGAEVPFTAYVYDSEGTIHRSAKLTWNFGDGATTVGDDVVHTYTYPGTYTVSIAARSGYAHVVSLLVVRVEQTSVRIETSESGQIIVHNDGSSLLDMSGWVLRADDVSFVLPSYSVVRPQTYMLLSREHVGLASSTGVIGLYASDGRMVAVSSSTPVESFHEEVVTAQPVAPVPGLQSVGEAAPQIVITEPTVYADATIAPDAPEEPAASGALHTGLAPILTSPWTASFLGLLLAAGAALVIL